MDETGKEMTAIDDRLVFIEAAMAITRLDEARHYLSAKSAIYSPGARRREAMGIASVDGAVARMESLCRVISDPEATNVERGSRVAADAYSALQLVENWTVDQPTTSDVIELFMTSDLATGRLMRSDIKWSIEEDSMWVVEQFNLLRENLDAWSAIETLRIIWTSGRFLGTSRRMALLLAPWIMAKGFECNRPTYGFADAVKSNLDKFRDASQFSDQWAIEVADVMRTGFTKERQKLKDAYAERTALLALCPPTRTSSSIEAAVEYMFEFPIFTAKLFAERLDITPRGAKIVLDRLLETNVIEVDNGSRNRKFTCRRLL